MFVDVKAIISIYLIRKSREFHSVPKLNNMVCNLKKKNAQFYFERVSLIQSAMKFL